MGSEMCIRDRCLVVSVVAALALWFATWQDSKFKPGRSDGDWGIVFVWALAIGAVAIGWVAWLIACLFVLWLA